MYHTEPIPAKTNSVLSIFQKQAILFCIFFLVTKYTYKNKLHQYTANIMHKITVHVNNCIWKLLLQSRQNGQVSVDISQQLILETIPVTLAHEQAISQALPSIEVVLTYQAVNSSCELYYHI